MVSRSLAISLIIPPNRPLLGFLSVSLSVPSSSLLQSLASEQVATPATYHRLTQRCETNNNNKRLLSCDIPQGSKDSSLDKIMDFGHHDSRQSDSSRLSVEPRVRKPSRSLQICATTFLIISGLAIVAGIIFSLLRPPTYSQDLAGR